MPNNEQISKAISFPIVAIGSSAGGLEALEQFLSNTPVDSGIAFVIIQHLDPNHKGIMPEILQRTTSMKVAQVTDQMQVKPNEVYVIPPNKSMTVLNGHLHLSEPIQKDGLRLPVDIFFCSLADDQQEKSIAIILSGMGSDGSLGLKSIKEKAGMVLVQDPLTAKFDGMPNSAIQTVTADIVAPANELPSKLIKLIGHSHSIQKTLQAEDKKQSNLEKIVILLRSQTGHDFSQYKKNTIYRRIERRMGVHQVNKIATYVHILQEYKSEVEILFKELLIGVTNFFRDEEVWDKLKDKVLPELLNALPNGYVLRVWITGCSTGEEAYSFAIVFKEAYEKVKIEKNLSLQIFATDIDSDAIETARKGIFKLAISANVSPERLKRFFTKKESSYTINTSIREMVVFATHNVIKDPPFTKLNFLFCRNLLIYLESELQKKLMNLFYYSLNPSGIMVLGKAENPNSSTSLFKILNKKSKIYKRNLTEVGLDRMDFPNSFSHPINNQTEEREALKTIGDIQTFAEQMLLQHFAPASILVNPEGDILYITGRTGKYLEPAAGKANMNIYAMAREGLRNDLLSAMRKVKKNGKQIILHNLKVSNNNGHQFVDITIRLVDKPEMFKGDIMIVFADTETSLKSLRKSIKGKQVPSAAAQELEIELQHALNELQTTREDMQSSQEELKSTNEELQSTNEELQSTNEELTTSKEEMQSMNEELQTVNSELQSKVSEFIEANSDMKNLLNSTDIATLFLDKNLNIRRFTEEVTKIFKLRSSDVGRPFTELVSDLNYPEIDNDAKEVIRTLIFKEIETSTKDNRWYTVKIMPYRTIEDKIDGLVITFIDISAAKKLEAELKEKIKILEGHNLLNNDKS